MKFIARMINKYFNSNQGKHMNRAYKRSHKL